MDLQELARRLTEIAKGDPGIIITERTCWLNGEECPYGRPEGQFLKRPRIFCMPNGGGTVGCWKLDREIGEINELTSVSVRQELVEEIKKATTKVSSELRALADGVENDQVKRTLELAAELIEKKEFGLEDREIVLLEDLELLQ